MEKNDICSSKQLLKRNRKIQKRKIIARPSGYAVEILIYMLQAGVRWKPLGEPINKPT